MFNLSLFFMYDQFVANVGNRKSHRADETCRGKENNSC